MSAPVERGEPVRTLAAARRLPLLTTSAVKCYRACPRLYKLSQEDLWRAIRRSDALYFGTLFHRALETWWRVFWQMMALNEPLEAALAELEGEADPFDRARAEALMIGYHYRWIDEPLEVLGVEKQFRAPHVNPDTNAASRTWDEGGKMDVIVRTPDGRVWVTEHKTSSEDITQGSTYWRRLRLDAQISTYIRGASTLGYGDIAGCLYDVIGKPSIRPSAVPLLDEDGCKIVHDATGARVRTKYGKKWRESADSAQGFTLQTRPETPEEFKARILADIGDNPGKYYQRGEIVRLEEDRRGAALDMWQTGRAIADSRRLNHWPRNPSACVSYGRTCEFFDVCTNAASLNDPSRFRKAEQQHEELVTE